MPTSLTPSCEIQGAVLIYLLNPPRCATNGGLLRILQDDVLGVRCLVAS